MLNWSFSTVSSNDSLNKYLSFLYEALLEKSLNHVSQWSIHDQSAHTKDNEDLTLTWDKKNLQRLIWSLSLLVWTSEEDESNNSWTEHLYFIIWHDIFEISMHHSTHLLMLLHHDHESSWDWKCWWYQTSCWFILVELHTT